ncbi:endolytic transglycosylase MltG [Pseudonocardia sp. MCCB 268]|nr:endolytic transglycosylase MltG [Pseudonocardia cytotoxica]
MIRALAVNQRLEMGSTVNYRWTSGAPDLAEARRAPGPYNTYLNTGLPPAPVASVSTAALATAAQGRRRPARGCSSSVAPPRAGPVSPPRSRSTAATSRAPRRWGLSEEHATPVQP